MTSLVAGTNSPVAEESASWIPIFLERKGRSSDVAGGGGDILVIA